MKIYITYTKDSFTEEQLKQLNEVGEVIIIEELFELDKAPYLMDDSEKILVADPDWYNWDINAEHLSKIKNLEAICLSTTAFDWIDLNYCKENNIIVTNIPKYSTDSVAEYAVFLLMSLAKKLPIQIKSNYKIDYSLPMLTTEIRNKTVGIIGLGHIGSRVAEICDCLGMNVIYWNRKEKNVPYKYVDLDTLFTESNFIIPAFVTNEETKKIITDELINKMNNNALINIVNNPNEIYNHNLMLKKAEEGTISYAFEKYDDKTMNDFKGNVMVTAPYAFYTKEAIDRLIEIWCQNVIAIAKEQPQNVVNN